MGCETPSLAIPGASPVATPTPQRPRDRSPSSSSYSSGSRSRSPARLAPPPPATVGLGAVVEIHGVVKAPELNGQRAVVVATATTASGSATRWEVLCLEHEALEAGKEARRVSLSEDRLQLVQPPSPEAVRLRFRNVPDGYTTKLMKEELDDEGFVEEEDCYMWLVHDQSRGFCYLTAATARVAMQIIGHFDGRRLQRCGPGLLPDSCLRQNVKLERL
eukprot:TRINITY_DN115530_c0_g1_i1.p1 TRINITY_DN115530_c0_g1~~TRINITY_DN115530_c0_g1_i1.p1  ORF type:complete len:218 (+),score=30.15 TRINITY_DN115530_c0_g1_i1:121-774(+)